MKTYAMKRVVVGIMLVILTLGFCVIGTGAARADQPGGPMNQQQGFGPGGNSDGQTPPEGGFDRSGDSFPGGSRPESGSDSDRQLSHDGGFGPGGQRDAGGHDGPGRDGGPKGMDNDVREAIEALDDGETKTNLETLMENVHTAMETLMKADDDAREDAEAAVKEARDALNEALTEAGLDAAVNEPPAKPEGEDEQNLPENGPMGRRGFGYDDQGGPNAGQNVPEFLTRENLEGIDLDDEEQVQNLFQRFLTWLQGTSSNT